MLIRLFVIAFLLVLVGRAARTFLGGPKKSAPESPRPLVVDPVCGLYIDKTEALSARDPAGGSVYFCSRECRDRYLSSPAPPHESRITGPPDGE